MQIFQKKVRQNDKHILSTNNSLVLVLLKKIIVS